MPDLHLRDLSTTQRWLLIVTLLFSLGFAAFFFLEGNYEFIGYFSFLLFWIFFFLITLKEIKLPTSLLAMLSLWSFLHMAGGSVHIGEERLYDLVVFPFRAEGTELDFIKYDQLVHFFGTGIVASALHWAIRLYSPHIKRRWRICFAALAAMGLGTLNEIIEFGAVLFLANTGVGGYYNNALDLVFNAGGAVAAVLAIELYLRLKNGPQ
jgi:putative membrane protein